MEELRDWLERDAELVKVKGKNTKLAYATKNACIKALNRFLATMVRYQKMKGPAPRCQMFPKHKINRKGAESYISDQDMDSIYEKLFEVDEACAEFFWVLCHTGLRLNEACGLAMSHIFKGAPKDGALKRMLHRYEIEPLVHVVLDSQPQNSAEPKDKNGQVKRKPLKHRLKIEPRSNRVIPISNRRAAEIIVRRYNEQAKIMKKFSSKNLNRSDFLLFEEMDKNRISNAMRKVFSLLGLPSRSPHDCRHTFCTNLVAQTEGHSFLARHVLGHADSKTTEGYLHLWELIQRNVVQEGQDEDTMRLD